MAENKNIELIIDGTTYRLGAYEDSEYMYSLADYINEKIEELRHTPGFGRLQPEERTLFLQLNMADECLQARKEARRLARELDDLERENYELKHQLVTDQIRREKENHGE